MLRQNFFQQKKLFQLNLTTNCFCFNLPRVITKIDTKLKSLKSEPDVVGTWEKHHSTPNFLNFSESLENLTNKFWFYEQIFLFFLDLWIPDIVFGRKIEDVTSCFQNF